MTTPQVHKSFIRISVVGTRRRVELAVATDEVVAGLLPRLRELLDEPAPASAPLAVVGWDGAPLRAGEALAAQVEHGAELRLVPAAEVPPPVEVADVTDVLADTMADRRARQLVPVATTGYVVALALVAAGAARLLVPAATLTARPAVAIVAVLLVVGLAVSALLLSGDPVSGRPVGGRPTGPRRGSLAIGLAAAAAGAAGSLVLSGLEAVAATADGDRTSAVLGCAALVAVAVAPRLAVAGSGLTRIDEDVVGGAPRPRGVVLGRADDAYRLLTWTTVAAALPLTAAIMVLVRAVDPWAAGLGLALALGAALRARAMPLPAQQVPLALSAVAGLLVLALSRRELGPRPAAAVLIMVAFMIIVGAGGARPRAAARLRRWAGRAEAVALAVVLPLALGAFGIYADLLGALA